MPNIYIVDDEDVIRDNLGFALKKEGYTVSPHPNGQEAWEAFQKAPPDLVLLDIMMPKMDGLELCRRIRKIDEHVPILFLSSRDEELDRIIGLEMGGDDYLCKPFSIRELLVRIKVILKRARQDSRKEDEFIRTGDLTLSTARGLCRWKDQPAALTITEFRILEELVREPGLIRTREQLMHAAFPEDLYANERALDSHIKRIRKKIQVSDPLFEGIDTIYGLGYRWNGGRVP
jgi:DNA-binding response OmpR family regulator